MHAELIGHTLSAIWPDRNSLNVGSNLAIMISV